MAQVGGADQVQVFLRLSVPVRRPDAESDVSADAQVGEEQGVLEDDAHPPFPRRKVQAAAGIENRFTADFDGPGLRLGPAQDRLQ